MHTEPSKYVVYVLWIIGHSMGTIERVTGKKRKQIAGLVARSPWPNRSKMTRAERQAALDALRRIRLEDGVPLDRGKFDNLDWRVIPLQKGQIRV
jgi:hypothetical protein